MFIDGTKIEANANRYSFVWKKSTEKKLTKLGAQIGKELVKQMAAREGVTEKLKAQDQMLWVQRMNNIRERAMEVVNNDLIHAKGVDGGDQSPPQIIFKNALM